MTEASMRARGARLVEQLLCELQAPINLTEGSQDISSAAEIAPVECLRAPERMFEHMICHDEHSMEDCYISSMCGHRMCRDAARKVTLGAIMCTAAALWQSVLSGEMLVC